MRSKTAILFVTTLSSFLTPFMGSAINIALPAIGLELEMNAIELGWVSNSYLLAAAVFLLPFGRLSDIYGRKIFFIGGIIVFSIASILSAVAFSSSLLLISRVLNGAGGALIYATAIAILTSSYPKHERGKVLGINVAAVYLGLSMGPTIGGFLIMFFGWRSIFVLTAFLSLIIIIPIAMRNLNTETKTVNPQKFDLTGSLIYGISLALIVYSFPSLPSAKGIILLIIGLAGFTAFVIFEGKIDNPLIAVGQFRKNHIFIFSNIAAFINYASTFALVFLLSLYLQQVLGLPPHQAGLILMAQPITMTIFSPLAGKLSDRIEPSIVASVGMGITVIGLFAFATLDKSDGIWFIVSMLIVLGLGFALFSSPNTNAVMSSVKQNEYGVASSILGTMRLTGQTISMGISMMIFALMMTETGKSISNTDGLLSGIKISFLVFALLSIAGVFFSLKRGKMRS
ncbi:MAG: MFS transporter [Bacteroidetes bacterium HGW-Bacteroidetes-11]|nr:MAG: MFS transporter [Bacteroidetes bacterium HGW-Bacteroidetes-11]